MRITIGLPELSAYLLWLAAVICIAVGTQCADHWLPMSIGLLSAMFGCTIFVRVGQERISQRIGVMIHLADMDPKVTQFSRSRSR